MASLHDASFFCIPETDLPKTPSVDYRNIYCIISLVSAFLGLFGSSYQLFIWRRRIAGWTSRRSNRPATNPVIIFNLALANLLSCLGVICRSVAMLVTKPPTVTQKWQNSTGEEWREILTRFEQCDSSVTPDGGATLFIWGSSVETFTQFSYAASVIWTFLYSVDTYAQLYGLQTSNKVYHATSWGLAAVMAIASQLTVSVGLNPQYGCAVGSRLSIRYFVAYVPMLVVLILNPIFLWSTQRQAKKCMLGHSVTFTNTERQLLTKLRNKFISIVFLFTLCWLPNQVETILQITTSLDCMYPTNQTDSAFHVLFPLWIIEAILNPMQGLLNCFVFGRRPGCLSQSGDRIHVNTQDSYSERQTLL